MSTSERHLPSDPAAIRPPPARADRDAHAGRADGPDPARADRDDDDRPRLDRAPRCGGDRRRRAGKHRLFHQLHLRPRRGVGGGAARRPRLRRPQRASNAARAARRPVGGARDFAADDGVSALRRTDPAGARTGARAGAARAAISVRRGVGRHAGAMADCHPRLHGRAQSSRAGAVDHARRDPRQRAPGLSPDQRPVGTAAARPVRRRSCDLDRQWRHVPGRAVVRHHAAAIREIPCARHISGASTGP